MNILDKKKNIIIKIGSNLLIKDGKINKIWLESLAKDVLYLKNLGKNIIIVSSGSIALGRKCLKAKRKLTLEEKQAAGSVGQIELMGYYQRIFAANNLTTGQILLTGPDSANRTTYLNSKNTFKTLFKNGIIAIVNENDTVATQEIKIGDNDRLAARVAQMIDADLLILLSDVSGLYDKNPKINEDAKFIKLVEKVTKKIENMATSSTSDVGTGGMITKIKAAKMAFHCGCDTIISNGFDEYPIRKLMEEGAIFTLFKSNKTKINAKKQWIIDEFNSKGELIINNNAALALQNGSSLLAVGIIKIIGKFEDGDNVLIKNPEGKHIATGITSYASSNARIIIGKNTSQIRDIFGKSFKGEVIHRDELVLVI